MALIIKQQDEIEVFANEYGQISIKANIPLNDEETVISFNKEYARLMCDAILDVANELE